MFAGNKCGGQGRVLVTQEVMPGFRMQSEQTCSKCHGRGRMFKHECGVCHGAGVHPQMTRINVEIERGMAAGDVVKFERKSEERPGHIPGDVHVQLQMEAHSWYRRDGDDLYTSVDVSLKQSLLGFDLNIEHMDKHLVNLKHYDVTHQMKRRKYKGEGMPKRGQDGRFGNLFVDYTVVFPEKITEEDRKTLIDIFGGSMKLDTFTPVPQ